MIIKTNIDFEILEELKSEGANSKLYIVRNIQLNKEFILKKIDKKSLDINKYFEESRKAYKLKHPNIIGIESTSYDENFIYISMPFCKKGSLLNLIKSRNLTIREIIKYSIEFLSAIDYMHTNNIIHCDIKPSNILIDNDDTAILADFGLSLYLNSFDKAKLKNVYYKHIAPEQSITSVVDKKIDIYQIGTTLYRMCNGDFEYNKQIRKYKNINDIKIACKEGKFPIRKKYLPHIPAKMIKIIEKCIRVNPNDRYENVSEIIYDLSKINNFLDWEYMIESKSMLIWYNKKIEKKIILSKESEIWNVTFNNDNNIFYTKGDSYKFIRNIMKEKTLL